VYKRQGVACAGIALGVLVTLLIIRGYPLFG